MKRILASLLLWPLPLAWGQTGEAVKVWYPEGREAITFEGMGYNPVSPMGVFMADPSAKVIDGKMYLACSLDLELGYWCSPYHHLLSTYDLRKWTLHTNVLASKGPFDAVPYSDAPLYAPDMAERNGRYYMYYDLSEGTEGIAFSDSGPFWFLQILVHRLLIFLNRLKTFNVNSGLAAVDRNKY